MKPIEVLPLTNTNLPRPLWSVMIPTYNCAKFLRETIESVLIQDRGIDNMEVWVVDDCSTDDPQQVVDELGKGRVKFYRQEKNVGQLNNFGTCLNLASGTIVHMLHGDDYVHAGFYKSLEKPLLENDSIGGAFTRHNIVDEKGDLILTSDELINRAGVLNNFLSLITAKNIIQTPSVVVKRAVYEKLGGFDKNFTSLEDWEMWIRIGYSFQVHYEPKILASYRVRENSTTKNSFKSKRFIEDFQYFLKQLPRYLKVPDIEKRKVINSAKQNFLNYTIEQGKQRKSYAIILRSFVLVHNYSSFKQVIKQVIILPFRLLKS
jgi:glycosyltransferase involved in cell wall biosynthesis